MSTREITTALFVVMFAIVGMWGYIELKRDQAASPASISSFEECAEAGYAVMESYPEQCRIPSGRTFTRDIGNELEKFDLIRTSSPRPGQTITSPLTIIGEARGYWFFEASFPVELRDANGTVIAQHYATAQHEWMTEEFVPFESTLSFETPTTKKGILILHKDNPSGLPEHDDALIMPVLFK